MTIYTFCGYDNNTTEVTEACLRNYYGSDCRAKLYHKEDGTPYIDKADLNVSISHTDKYFILAISNSRVGIDIERIKERSFEAIARKFLGNEVSDLRDFYLEWTKMESQFKHGGEDGKFRSFDVFKDIVLTVYSEDTDIIFIPYESFKEEK